MESSGRIADDLLKAFSAADIEAMRSLLAEDLVAFITNAEGGLDRVEGREEYLSRIEAMDLPSARFSVELTQAPVPVDSEQVLIMVEARVADGRGQARRERRVLVLEVRYRRLLRQRRRRRAHQRAAGQGAGDVERPHGAHRAARSPG